MKYTLLSLLIFTALISLAKPKSWTHQQNITSLLNPRLSYCRKRPITQPGSIYQKTTTSILIILLAGDIELNPGPTRANIFPCGLCDRPVTWSNEGVCCDCCSIWHHRSCIELCTEDYELLQRSNVQWMCCKCDSINVTSFIYHSYEIENVSYYEPLTTSLSHMDSYISTFSPLRTSSPKSINTSTSRQHKLSSSNKSTETNIQDPIFNLPNKRNLRIMTINCRSIKDKTAEFKTTVEYTKPDIIIGTESWLKGVKPGKNPSKDAIKSSEIFPVNYTAYRNDRGILGGGVFILVHNNLIGTELPQYVTKCEIDWVKIKLKTTHDLLIGAFYMPHRNSNSIEELNKSLQQVYEGNKTSNIILAGDFNCPDIEWEKLSVRKGASDTDVQQAVIDISSQYGLTQVHEEPTREKNILDLIFTSNASLTKSSTSIPGISDHVIVVTDIKPHYQKSNPHIWSKDGEE